MEDRLSRFDGLNTHLIHLPETSARLHRRVWGTLFLGQNRLATVITGDDSLRIVCP
jgi:hypothetical protein